jgi:hypothetical protein
MATGNNLNETIAEAAAAPQSTTTDGVSVTEHSLPDQIAAAKFLANQQASQQTGQTGKRRSGWAMLRPAKAVPPGGVS